MVDDHEAALRRDHNAFERDRAVLDSRRLLMQQRDRGHELPDETQIRVQLERHSLLSRDREQVDRRSRRPRARTPRTGSARSERSAEWRKPGRNTFSERPSACHAFAQRALEGVGAELISQFEYFDEITTRCETRLVPLPESIFEDRGLQQRCAGSSGTHGCATVAIPKFVPRASGRSCRPKSLEFGVGPPKRASRRQGAKHSVTGTSLTGCFCH